jgi:hypothetical protein
MSEPTIVTAEIWIAIDADGNCVAGTYGADTGVVCWAPAARPSPRNWASHDLDQLAELWESHIGDTSATPVRRVRVLVEVPFAVPTLKGRVPAEGEALLSVE